MTARSEGIYREARAIAIDWLSRTSARREGGAEYEAACWVDGVTLATLDEHCSFLQESTTLASTIFIDLSHAWRKIGLPAPVPKSQVSTILVWALRSLSRASNALGFLIVQVATKCLIRDLDPLPFAVLIIDAVETEHTASTYFIGHLKEYAQSIVYFDRYSGANRAALATRLLKVCFSSDSYPLTLLASNSHAVRSPGNRFHLMYDGDDCLSLNRQMIHLAAAFEDDGRVRCDYVVQHLLPVTIVVRRTCKHYDTSARISVLTLLCVRLQVM